MKLQILQGDALTRLCEMPTESVQCCVTSPPYWGLRDYGTATWEGGDSACEHVASTREYTMRGASSASAEAFSEAGEENAERLKKARWRESGSCKKCGAVRIDHQLGLEKTPEEFVAKIVEVFREVRRVLKSDGTCWVNLGDSYATGAGAVGNCPGGGAQGERWRGSRNGHEGKHGYSEKARGVGPQTQPNRLPVPGLKPKDLCGIPWRVAFALQAAGWYLRSDIIWHKPNPMPESITDRPTKAHEYLFLLTKSERYYYDAEAIKEPVTGNAHARGEGVNPKAQWKSPDGWDTSTGGGGHGSFHKKGREKGKAPRARQNESFSAAVRGLVESRNKRSVWTVPTFAYPEAHYATYPPDLIKPCILAGSRPGDVILDPFAGSGTTGQVALELGRSAILIELSQANCALIERRCAVTPGFF